MTHCKSCGNALTPSAAGASIFALSFLPVRGKKLLRRDTTKLAEKVGPLCPGCLERRKDLAIEDETRGPEPGVSAKLCELDRKEPKLTTPPELRPFVAAESLARNQIERIDADSST